MRCSYLYVLLFLAALFVAVSYPTTPCAGATVLIGDWRWGADGTVSPFNGQVAGNYAKDAYHGIEVHGVTVGNGVLEVRTSDPRGGSHVFYGDKFVRTATIDELAGLTQMMWTFEDVTFLPGGATANQWYLAGSVKVAAFSNPEHLFWMGVARHANTGVGTATMYLWDGTNNDVKTHFNMDVLTLDTQAYDLQFEFDGRDGPTDNVTFRMREAGESLWTTELTGNNPVARINGPPTWDVAIGKNRPGSSTIGDMNMGRVTLHIPEPGTGLMCGLLLAGLAMFRRSRRR